MNDVPEKRPAKNAWRTATLVSVGCLSVLIGMMIYGFSSDRIRLVSDQERNAMIARELPPATTKRLEHALAAALSYPSKITTDGKSLAINVDLDNEKPSSITYQKIVRVFANALSAVHDAGYQDLDEVMLNASYPLADKRGQETETTVASVTLNRDSLSKFNWDHILRSDVFEATKHYQFHPIVERSPMGHSVSQTP